MSRADQTPMMKQFHAAKAEHPDCVLFFRMGDFYELFHDDAVDVSKVLGLTLTSRSKGDDAIPMAGVPVRAVDGYLRKLVARGYRVAICDQVEDPKKAKDIVERKVVRVVTPGTLTEDDALDTATHNFVAAVAVERDRIGLAWADLSTGAFLLEDIDASRLDDELTRLEPAEVLVADATVHEGGATAKAVDGCGAKRTTALPDVRFGRDAGRRALVDHLGVRDLAGFGCDDLGPALGAGGALLGYLRDTQQSDLSHIHRIERYRDATTMFLDRSTRRALELTANAHDGGRDGTLVQVLDRTVTPMGARRLKEWLVAPLRAVDAIRHRQAAVTRFVDDRATAERVRELLGGVHDVERLAGRLGVGRANARDLVALARSLAPVGALADALASAAESTPFVSDAHARLDPCPEVQTAILDAIVDEPPVLMTDGGLLREGYDAELDELRRIGSEGKDYLERYREREAEACGIPNLKIGFNRVFGYYLEITNAHADRAPAHFTRKQTLKNAERYITPELKEYESKVLNAEERIKEIEYQHVLRIRDEVAAHVRRILETAAAIADIDAVGAFADVAVRRAYVRPTIDESRKMAVTGGRHPVLEVKLGAGEFVANDLAIDGGGERLVVLTGPNMAGKSTFIRQAALHVVMAQAGGYVPAERATIGVVDRVFTRVGASDDLSRGRSTFMVEMTEVANILNNATDRSLLVLDEVGRGTSTYDGVSIAWAVAEHLATAVKARTLFATHYHELTDLPERIDGVKNMNVSVREWGDDVVFLHRIVAGGCDRSYGVHVARLAGVPDSVLARARSILESLQAHAGAPASPADAPAAAVQPSLFGDEDDPVIRALREAQLDGMTPLDALNFLADLKSKL